jgi:hypothetical protein
LQRAGRERADGRHAEVNCAAGRADDLDGLDDLAPVGFAELAEVVSGPPDELPQPGDLLVGRRGLGSGPVVEVAGGPDAFPGLQQAVEVVAELGEVGRVGSEVTAAQAAEPERAGSAAGLDVGRLGTHAERDRHLADCHSLVLAVEQGTGLAPDPTSAAVELESRQSDRSRPRAEPTGYDPRGVSCLLSCRQFWPSSESWSLRSTCA